MARLYHPQRSWGARIHESSLAGIATTVLENRRLRLTVVQGKGTDAVEINYKPLDLDFVWLTPGGVRNPVNLHESMTDPPGSFLDTYPGGCQEVSPNGGIPSQRASAAFGQHREVFALPWDVDVVEDAEDRVTVRFRVAGVKTPCSIEKTINLDAVAARIEISARLTNSSPVPYAAMWGHHITLGHPFLQPGREIEVPNRLQVIPHPGASAPCPRRIRGLESFPWPIADGADGEPLDIRIIPEQGTAGEMLSITGFPEAGT